MTLEALLQAAVDGEPDASKALGMELQVMLLEKFSGDADADDIVQAALAQIWLNLERYDLERGSVRAWAMGIARNVRLEHLRRHYAEHDKRERFSLGHVSVPRTSPSEYAQRRERARLVDEILPGMSKTRREAIEDLRAELSAKEAGGRRGITADGARRRLRRSIDDARGRLERIRRTSLAWRS